MANVSHRQGSGVTPEVVAGGLLNVLSRDIVADGVTDQVAELNAVIAYARSNGYGGILLPEGEILIGGADATERLGVNLTGITDFVIAGSGPGSVLKMSKEFSQDRRIVYLRNGSERIVLRDFTIDGNWEGETGNEQVHLIQLGTGETTGTVDGVTIENLWLKNCKGDAVRLLGADNGGEVTNVSIDSNRFTDCDRCGIAVQRGTYDVHITDNTFSGGSDQQLDMEATGASSVGRYIVTGNNFDGTGRDDSTVLVTLGGSGADTPNSYTVFADNIVRGRVQITNTVGLRFTDNTVVPGVEGSAEATVHVLRVCKDAVITGNHFERPEGETAGPVVLVTQNSSLVPDGIVFAGNTIIQRTAQDCVLFDGCDNISAYGNTIKFYSSSTATYRGIALESTLANLESFSASNNTIIGNLGGGTLGYGVHVNTRTNALGRCVVNGNSIKSAVNGVLFEKSSGSFTNFPVCLGNQITGATTPVSHASQTIVIGGQQGSVADLVGTGDPESSVAAPVGSTFRRTDGEEDATLYIKETGSSTTGWVAL